MNAIRLPLISGLAALLVGCATPRGYLADRAADLTDAAHLNLTAFSFGQGLLNVGPAVVGYQRIVGLGTGPGFRAKAGLGGIEYIETGHPDDPTVGVILPFSQQKYRTRSLVGYGKQHPPWGSVGCELGFGWGIGARVDAVEIVDFALGWFRLDILRDDKKSPAPFLPIGEDLGFGYSKAGENIYFGGGQDWPNILRQQIDRPVDAGSFQALSVHYTKDKNTVYYNSATTSKIRVVALPAADPATFEVIGSERARDKNGDWWYGRPADQPGWHDTPSEDQSTRDAARVWVNKQPVPGADPATFRHLGADYYVDQQRAYWRHHLVAGADPKTLRPLANSLLAVDAKAAYLAGNRLAHVDPSTCRLIQHNRSSNAQVFADKNGVYLNRFSFRHAKPEDFTMLDMGMAKGQKHIFLIDFHHSTPITVYKRDRRLIAETYLYDYRNRTPLAVVKLDITETEGGTTVSPLPGISEPIPDSESQIRRFRKLMRGQRAKAARFLESASGRD
jgi:hypothetical protein